MLKGDTFFAKTPLPNFTRELAFALSTMKVLLLTFIYLTSMAFSAEQKMPEMAIEPKMPEIATEPEMPEMKWTKEEKSKYSL